MIGAPSRCRWLGALLGLLLGAGPAYATNLLEVIEENGPSGNRIDLVIIGDGFTAAEADLFRQKADVLLQGLFGETPWAGYRGLFNLYRVVTQSAESGADHPSQGVYRNTYFNAQFDYYGISRLTFADVPHITSVVTGLLPEVDQIVLLINDPAYGGSGGSVAMVSVHASAVRILVHELGHSYGHLADEYTDPYPGYPAGDPEPNVDVDAALALIKWDAWIAAGTPLPTSLAQATGTYLPVGAYEGARYLSTGIFRPAPNCLMRSLTYRYCDVCREAMVLGFYAEVDPLDSVSPTATTVTVDRSRTDLLPVAFAAEAVLPSAGSPLAITWTLDGQPVATGPAYGFDPVAEGVADGPHTLRCEVLDPTPFVRADPGQRLRSERTWTVVVQSGGPVIPDASLPVIPDATLPVIPDATLPVISDASVPTGGSDASVPSGGPDASVPTGGPDASVPSGGPDASRPSGDVDATVPSASSDAAAPSSPDGLAPGAGSPRVVGGCACGPSGGSADPLPMLFVVALGWWSRRRARARAARRGAKG